MDTAMISRLKELEPPPPASPRLAGDLDPFGRLANGFTHQPHGEERLLDDPLIPAPWRQTFRQTGAGLFAFSTEKTRNRNLGGDAGFAMSIGLTTVKPVGMYLPGQPTERAAKGTIAIRLLFERQKVLRKGDDLEDNPGHRLGWS